MKQIGTNDCTTMTLSLERKLTIDGLRLGASKHPIYILMSIDVTEARALLRQYKEQSGESLSLTAYLTSSFGKTIHRHKRTHGVRSFTQKIYLFDAVDISVMIETEFDGRIFPVSHILRATNHRPLLDLHEDLRNGQRNSHQNLTPRGLLIGKIFYFLPWFIRRLVFKFLFRIPSVVKSLMGTAVVSSMGMAGPTIGWVQGPLTIQGVGLLIGGISKQTVIGRDAVLKENEMLQVTIYADHDLVDGSDVARFAHEFGVRVTQAEELQAIVQSGIQKGPGRSK